MGTWSISARTCYHKTSVQKGSGLSCFQLSRSLRVLLKAISPQQYVLLGVLPVADVNRSQPDGCVEMPDNDTIILAIDFDGTLVDHQFPEIGEEVPGALEWCKRFQESGARLILWTMRSDGQRSGNVLQAAVDWCRERGLEFWGVNANPSQSWSNSNKAYAHAYIDDAAVGCPMLVHPEGGRKYVDWSLVGPEVVKIIEEW